MSAFPRKRLAFFLVAALIFATALYVIQAQLSLRVSPLVQTPDETFDEAALTTSALEHAKTFGLNGDTESTETYVITLGQWYTLNNMRANAVEGFPRETPVFVLKGYGNYSAGGPMAVEPEVYDRVIVAIYAGTGQFLGMTTYPPGVSDLLIDFRGPDAGDNFTPHPPAPLLDDKDDADEPLPLPTSPNS